jgi:hypothetical protein
MVASEARIKAGPYQAQFFAEVELGALIEAGPSYITDERLTVSADEVL